MIMNNFYVSVLSLNQFLVLTQYNSGTKKKNRNDSIMNQKVNI